jgi:broad specificity phosphatase PhoE
MTRIIMIRHGQSQANARELFAGHSDFDLSELGALQASKAAEYLLKKEKITAIYASDLLRAYHTACHIADAFGLPVTKDKGLREIYAGKWESLSFSEIAEKYPNAFKVWKTDYSNARPVGGESTAEVYERIVPHVTELAQKHDGETVLLATHATVVRAFDAYARGFGSNETGMVPFSRNASINIFKYGNGRAEAISSDIVEHLGDLAVNMSPKINA